MIAVMIVCIRGSCPARADTLADAITMADQSNPTLLQARAQLRALNETYVQARAGLRPQVGASAETDYTNAPTTLQIGVQDAAAGVTASQPLFTAGLVSAQIRSAEAQILAGRQKLRQIEADVVQGVVQSYVDVRRDLQALSIADQEVAVLQKQLEETQARFDAGDVTRTDIAQSEARLAASRAARSSALAQLTVSRTNYAAVVGQDPGVLDPEPPIPDLPPTIEAALSLADLNSPVLLGANYAEQAATADVSAAKAANGPTISLRAQYGYVGYYANDPFLGVHNGLYDHNITASIVVSQPIFVGGANASHVRQALEDDSAQLIAIHGAERQTVQAVDQAWAQLQAARANVTAETEQVRADEVAYEGSHEEQQVGQRTVLDVLNAEQELRNAQLALVGARHDEYVAGTKLLNAAGLLSVRTFAPAAPAYDPVTDFNKVKHAGAVPWEGLVHGLDSIGAPLIRQQAPAPPAAPIDQAPVPTGAGAQVVP